MAKAKKRVAARKKSSKRGKASAKPARKKTTKRVAAHKKSSKRGKASAKPARKKTTKRVAPKKAKSKVRRVGVSATRPAAKKRRSKTAAGKISRKVAEALVETTIIDVIEEPVPGVIVVTEYESVGTATPILPGGEPESDKDAGPGT